ncbi:Mpv17 / PMP22 family protein [Nitzschia inconspicua]|uniref:Mpv17 / PMP22 family protein n=1 Tax=Nitzschia inconspicua TaxID=303405 RepID=A0A9K3LRT1_9STRA|nr:Mpv17 / PMP22 family protein [Nitzschia inconspicua]
MLVSSTLRAGLQSGTIMSLADALTQTVIEKQSSAGRYDVMRTLRWGVCGLVLHGPYFLAGFSAIDKRLGAATSWKVVAQKTAIAQFVLFPPYLCLLFSLMGALEGHPKIIEKVQRQVPKAFLGGCIYWPIANGINFSVVPGSMRVPYLAVSAGIWNSYLSWSNQRGNQTIDSNRNQTPKIG